MLRSCLLVAAVVLAKAGAALSQGMHGHGHEPWHGEFYSKLNRPDMLGKHSCCNLNDCRPTVERRSPHGYYEVMVDGEWVIVPHKKIVPITAPDGGAHVCAQKRDPRSMSPAALFCVVLPPES